jgi:hypothetical protein
MATSKKTPAAKQNPDVLVTPKGQKLSLNPQTLAGVGRSAILAGLTNDEVVMALTGAFPNFPVEKRSYYARWYRAQLVMLGVIKSDDPRASDASIRHGDEATTRAKRAELKQQDTARRAATKEPRRAAKHV